MGPTFTNPAALTYSSNPSPALRSNTVYQFHRSLPTYSGPSRLVSLPSLAESLGVQNLFLKDESFRFGDLPSFKPLGLSWAIRNGIIAELSEEASTPIPEDISLSDLASKAREGQIKLIAASDGKLGKAVARLGKLFGVEGTNVRIFVPEGAPEEAANGVRDEGAEAIPVEGSFEDSMREAVLHSVAVDGVFIDIDEAENYEDIPRWIVEGYSTIFRELDDQLEGRYPDLVVVPVGIGGLAQSAVMHYTSTQSGSHTTKVLGVEPEGAAALQASLLKGDLVSLDRSGGTILQSLDYGKVAEKAWDVLREGLYLSTIVNDEEVRLSTSELQMGGLAVGPCGGAVLAGLKNVLGDDRAIGDLTANSIVVLVSTEGTS